MNSLLWGIQAVVALIFFAAGSQKLLRRRDARGDGPARLGLAGGRARLIGLLEILGAIGIVVPAATGVYAFLTPLAAFGLACLMLGAIALELRRHEIRHLAIPASFLFLALVVGWGRFVA